jgi:hypothetical protein
VTENGTVIERLGFDAWVVNTTATTPVSIRIGLTGNDYEKASLVAGKVVRNATVSLINDAGQVVGTTQLHTKPSYASSASTPQDVWIWQAADGVDASTESVRVGLSGGIYESDSGASDGKYRRSTVAAQNQNGLVAGTTERHRLANGVFTVLGEDAWVWDGSVASPTSVPLGLFDTDHQTNKVDGDGNTVIFRRSSVFGVSDSGHVAGVSDRNRTSARTRVATRGSGPRRPARPR